MLSRLSPIFFDTNFPRLLLFALLSLFGLAACEEPYELKPGEFRDCDVCPIMVEIPPGSFMMGSPEDEVGRDNDEGPVHRVTINYRFAVSKFEITQGEWKAIVGYDKGVPGGDNDPIIAVNWETAQSFTRILSEKTGKTYRLLSESEWEYATRAGIDGPFNFGDVSPKRANYNTWNDYLGDEETAPNVRDPMEVGSFPPNAFGLHDMHGNVSEWVEDCYYTSYKNKPLDGSAAGSHLRKDRCFLRVIRGGNSNSPPERIRSADRFGVPRYHTNLDFGIRVARTID